MYAYRTVRTYIEAASAGNPTPGGGSVAALAGALAASMACMAANFTVGREKFKAVEPQVREQLNTCLAARDELLRLMDKDVEAYGAVSAAYGLPRETAAEKSARKAAIQQALLKAMTPPLETFRVCLLALRATAKLADLSNPNLISDVGVAAILAEAALRAAKLNIEINLRLIKNAEIVSRTRKEIEAASETAAELAAMTLKKVSGVMESAE